MRKIIIPSLFVLMVLLSSCGILTNKRTTELISFNSNDELVQFLEQGDWSFELEHMSGYMVPRNFNAQGYDIKVADGTIRSQMPFFGRSYRASYSGSNPMSFKKPITLYEVRSLGEDKGVELFIETTNEDGQRVFLNFNIFSNGKVYIISRLSESETMNYSGFLYRNLNEGEIRQ